MLRAFFLGMALATTTALSAQAQIFLCDVKGFGVGGWTDEQMLIQLDTKTSTATVTDGLILFAKKHSITVPIVKRKNGNYRFEWTLRMPSTVGHDTKLRYRTDLNPTTGKGNINGTIESQPSQRIGGRLTCAPRKGS